MTLMQLHSACWKYNQVTTQNPEMILEFSKWYMVNSQQYLEQGFPSEDLFDIWIEMNTRHHVHIGCFDLSDVFTVVEMRASGDGVWQLVSRKPRLHVESATSLFQEVKRKLRSQVKNGPFEVLNACSHKRIENTFWHLQINQHVNLYDPEFDGIPEF